MGIRHLGAVPHDIQCLKGEMHVNNATASGPPALAVDLASRGFTDYIITALIFHPPVEAHYQVH